MFKSFFWAFIEKGGQVVIQFIALVVLGRLLMPCDYGVYGTLMIFISFAEFLVDSGFGGALVQKKIVNQKDINTLFTTNVVLSIVLYLVLYCVAPLIASFYNIPEVSTYLRVLGIVVVIYSFSIVQTTLLQRELRLKETAFVMLISSLISVTLTIVLALFDYGVWALIMQQLFMAVSMVIGFWIKDRRNIRLGFSVLSFRELWGFGSKILLANSLQRISGNLSSAMVPKISSITTAGFLVQAEKLFAVPVNVFTSTIDKATFPILSRETLTSQLINKARGINQVVVYWVLPFFFILSLFSKEFLVIVLGEKWIDSASFLTIISLGGGGLMLQALQRNIFKSLGDTKTILSVDTVKFVLGLLILGLSIRFGVYFMVTAFMSLSYVGSVLYFYFLHKKYAYNVRKQIDDYYIPFLAVIVCYSVFYWIESSIDFAWYNVFLSLIFYLLYLFVGLFLRSKPLLSIIFAAYARISK